jgi:hypothetical protein
MATLLCGQLTNASSLVDDYIQKIDRVECSVEKVEKELKENLREEFKTINRIEGNKKILKGMNGLLDDAAMVAKVQTALQIGPLVGVGMWSAMAYSYASSYFSLSFLVDATMLADKGTRIGIQLFTAAGILPTFFLSDDVVLKDLEDEKYNDVKVYLNEGLVISDINEKLEELHENQPEIKVNEEGVISNFLEERMYWKKALRYEDIIENIIEQQRLLTAKTKSLEYQKSILEKICY